MARKAVWMIGWMLVLCLFLYTASAEGFSRDMWFEMGLESLEEMTEESAAEAAEFFSAAGSYGQAVNYRIYAQSLSEILSAVGGKTDDLGMTEIRLRDLEKIPEFGEALASHDFPPCGGLITYLEALRMEMAGNYYSAWKKYAGIRNVLDAAERIYEMIPRAYEQADRYCREGRYEEAARIFSELNWKDSAARYAEASSKIEHRWTEADCSHPRTCTLHGETEGEPLGHDWIPATYTAPETCSRCGKTEGQVRKVFGFSMTMDEINDEVIKLTDTAAAWTAETAPRTLTGFPFFPDDLSAVNTIIMYGRGSAADDGGSCLFSTNFPDYLAADPPSFAFLEYGCYDAGSDTIGFDGAQMDSPESHRFLIPEGTELVGLVYDSTWVTGEVLSDIHFLVSFFPDDGYTVPAGPAIYLWYKIEEGDYYCLGWNWPDQENVFVFFRHLSETSDEDWRCWYTLDAASAQMILDPERSVFGGQISDFDPYFY